MIAFAKAVTTCSFVWILSFLLFGGSQKGKEWYINLAERSINDDHSGGVPMLMLAVPILVCSTVCAICLRAYRGQHDFGVRCRWNLPRNLPTWAHRLYHRCAVGEGGFAFDIYALVFILLPCIVYVLSSIRRHLEGNDGSAIEISRHVGNSFGMMSMVALTVFLVPVAKQGPILKIFGWSPARAVRLHIWCGRVIVIGSLLHGIFHALRWSMLGEKFWSVALPPRQCWTTDSHSSFEPVCNNDTTECSCYDHFRNLTGILAAGFLLIIGLTSLHSVRRRFYCLFYTCHILAAPIVIIAIVMHYNQAILYIAPSFIYYTASSLPAMIQNRRAKGTPIDSVERIAGSIKTNGIEGHPCIALTFEASDVAIEGYKPGMYVKLSVPEVSTVSHPFTVNKVPGRDNRIRIIFQEVGSFTSQLVAKLTAGNSTPEMVLDGYHGSTDRLEQFLSHDVVVIVAGGIGITPYLSLLTELITVLSEEERPSPLIKSFLTRKIVIHWACRNPNLIDYVSQEYFQPIMDSMPYVSGLLVHIHIHQTGRSHPVSTYSGLPLATIGTEMVRKQSEASTEACNKANEAASPFTPFENVSGQKRSGDSGFAHSILIFAIITWLGLVVTWILYSSVQQENQIWQRLLAPFAIVALAVIVTLVFNMKLASYVSLSFCSSSDVVKDEKNAGKTNTHYSHHESSDSLDTVETISSTGDSQDLEMGKVILEKTHGRPIAQEILRDLDAALSPGVFSCGPCGLTQEVRMACEERSIARLMEEKEGEICIPVYNEAFAM